MKRLERRCTPGLSKPRHYWIQSTAEDGEIIESRKVFVTAVMAESIAKSKAAQPEVAHVVIWDGKADPENPDPDYWVNAYNSEGKFSEFGQSSTTMQRVWLTKEFGAEGFKLHESAVVFGTVGRWYTSKRKPQKRGKR